jgi:PAS domain S-box-containing protein
MDITNYILLHTTGNLYWKDTQGRYLGCNLEFAKAAGLESPQEIVGKSDRDLLLDTLGEEGINKVAEVDQYVLNHGAEKISEEVGIDKTGNKAYYLTKKIPLRDEEGNIIGLVGNSLNITERKRQEEELRKEKERAEAANKAKTEFLENMRHDIRTPLTGIVGFAEIIKNEVADPKIKEYTDNLVASSHALLDLLNGVLEAISVSSDEVPLLRKKFQLKEKLNNIILLNQAKAHQKNLELSFDYDPAIPAYLIGDVTRLHRVALELVNNALNFTNKGSVRLSVRLAKDTEDDVVIRMVVEDTGIGIESEKQQDIYVQFKRLTPSYEGIYKGFGLGLSIVKQFVDDLQGELYVDSQVGVGSKFIVIVKLRKSLLDESFGSEEVASLNNEAVSTSAVEVTPVTKIDSQPSASHKQSRILVVEDNSIAARVVVGMLSSLDCQVDVAEKGKLAVQMAEENHYDLIFMDIGLPDIDGYEVTKRIRLSELNKKHVPIIALTAHMDEDNKQHCIGIGMNAVLTKPLAREKAEDILNSFIPYRKDQLKSAMVSATEEEAVAELPVFDFEQVKNQFGNEKSALEMVTMFVDSLPQEAEQIQAAYDKKDWHSVQLLTHRLKGGVSYCGASRLGEICLKLESAIKEEQSELWEELYQQLLNEISLAEKAIKTQISNVASA